MIEYTVTDSTASREPEVFRLITTILDPDDLAAAELAAAYHERWEYEISLKEIETQMLEPGSGLRPKSPEMVRQEMRGLLLAHYAVRALMAEAAESAGLDPDPVAIHPSYQRRPPPGRRPTRWHFPPRRLTAARAMAIREILERVNKGRRKRTYPRVIKKYIGRTYPEKKASQTGGVYDPALQIPASTRRLVLTKWHWC